MTGIQSMAMPKSKGPPPEGYEEIGETLAQPVLEGFKNDAWALEIAGLLGYGSQDLEAWKCYYRALRVSSLNWQKAKRANRRAKIEESLRRHRELVEGVDPLDRSGYT